MSGSRATYRERITTMVILLAASVVGCGDDTEIDDAGVDASADAERRDVIAIDAADVGERPLIVSEAPCELSGVRTVIVDATQAPSAPRLELRYRVFPSASADAPVVVVVPGGPGQALMADDAEREFALSGVPTGTFSVIYIDARGSGCNVFSDVGVPDAELYTIDRVAEDLVDIVRNESLRDYYLYGASFGTAVVTVAAHHMELRGDALPRRLVLEGVVGRSFESFEAYFAEFEREWERVAPTLDSEWQVAFSTEPWPADMTWTRAQWGTFISAQLILGDYPGQGHLLDYWLRGLSAGTPAATRYVTDFMDGVPPDGYTDVPGGLFSTIACRELWGDWRSGREIRDGALRAIGDDVCRGEARSAYDAAEFPSTIPVTYFHGPFDPTTTTLQAEYHYDTHVGARRDFIVVPDAAHAPLTLGLTARGCVDDVWLAIAGGRDMAGVLSECERVGESIELRSRTD